MFKNLFCSERRRFMRNKFKVLLCILLPILAILLIGGVIVENQKEEQHNEMIRIAKEHEADMNKEVRYGDKDHHIKTITYEWNTVEKNPMGGFMLDGYVNNDKKLGFGIQFDRNNGKIEPRMYTCANQIDEWEGQE